MFFLRGESCFLIFGLENGVAVQGIEKPLFHKPARKKRRVLLYGKSKRSFA